MDSRIRFETKEESNARREREFLALTPHERFLWFLRSFDERRSDPDAPERPTKNFVIRKKRNSELNNCLQPKYHMKDLNTLLVDLDAAVHLSAQFTGGYSGEYLSAEDFHKDLSAAVVKLKAGHTSVLERLLWWFAPTCEWDDFITEGGLDLGNRIYSTLLMLNIADRPDEQHDPVR